MLTDFRWWLILALLLVTMYVINVGWQIENITGIKRAENLDVYRSLFGGPPWVQWIMFRFGGFILGAGIVTIFLMYGWWRGALSMLPLMLSPLVFWRTARAHAQTMLDQQRP